MTTFLSIGLALLWTEYNLSLTSLTKMIFQNIFSLSNAYSINTKRRLKRLRCLSHLKGRILSFCNILWMFTAVAAPTSC